jgi:IclR family transcriptional regulator, acetate operon repressor
MSAPTGGVQSLHRALDILESLAANGGNLTVVDIASGTGLPVPTAHRLVRTLAERGYVRQLANRSYALGYRLMPLAAVANSIVGAGATPVLSELVSEIGETANLAVLAGGEAEYIAQVPSRYAMRMFTEVGRRVELHCTGVGKALLAQLDDDAVGTIVDRRGLAPHTPHTLTTRVALLSDLREIRQRGYALDDQEQEVGVRCVAAPIPAEMLTGMAVSVSGPVTRMTDDLVKRAVPLLHSAARQLASRMVEPDSARA